MTQFYLALCLHRVYYGYMAETRKTSRHFRLNNDVYKAAQARAKREYTTITAVIEQYLAQYAGLVAAGTSSPDRGSDDPKPGTAAASSPATGTARGQRARTMGYSKEQQARKGKRS